MDKHDISKPVTLENGVYKLNPERNFDNQLNRIINRDGRRIEDIRPIAGRIKTSAAQKLGLK